MGSLFLFLKARLNYLQVRTARGIEPHVVQQLEQETISSLDNKLKAREHEKRRENISKRGEEKRRDLD